MRTIQRKIVGAFVFSNDEHILLGKSIKGGVYQGVWLVPGGGIENDETSLEAIVREAKEEVGIDISIYPTALMDTKGSGTSEKVLRDTGEKVVVEMDFINFRVDIPLPARDIALSLDDDLSEAKWIKFSELKDLDFSPAVKNVLEVLNII